MPTYLLISDALSSPWMRHEVGESIMDVIGFIDHEGHRIVVGSLLEEDVFGKREDVVDRFWNVHDLGAESLIADRSFDLSYLMTELTFRALSELGVGEVLVPPSFGVSDADYLRSKGVEVTVDTEAWIQRRRRKTPWELEGMERAQRAADTAMAAAARMLRESEAVADGKLRFEGEILTAGLIRQVMSQELLTQGAESEEIIVHSGDACLAGHELGHGPILADQSCIIDCFPRDRRTGVYTDMTRTFVPGRPSSELATIHAHCRKALDIALDAIRPGADDVHALVTEFFHSQGVPTREHHDGSEVLREGFFHSTGHGVGLEVHERPRLGRRPDRLQEGDVIAIEPGVYHPSIGGVRLEDTVLVTADGFEHLTDPLSYDLEP